MTEQIKYTQVTWTDAGLKKLLVATSEGVELKLTHVSAGTESYSPSTQQTALKNEQEKVLIGGAEKLSSEQVRFSALFESTKEYRVGEMGIWSDSTLVAVHSIPNVQLNYKSAYTRWLEVFSLNLAPLPSKQVSFSIGLDKDDNNIFFAKELATVAYSQIVQGKSLIEQAHRNLKLEERLRKADI